MISSYRRLGILLLLGETLLVGCKDPNPVFGGKSLHLDARTGQDTGDSHEGMHTFDSGSHDGSLLAVDLRDALFDSGNRSEAASDARLFDIGLVDQINPRIDTNLSLGDSYGDSPIEQPKTDTHLADTKWEAVDTDKSSDTHVIPRDAASDYGGDYRDAAPSKDTALASDIALSLLNGAACTASNQCRSGSCVDGVCCFSQQCGLCESCNQPGTAGICTSTCPIGQTCQIGICKPRLNFQRVSAGGFSSCKLNLNDSLSCWGVDVSEQEPLVRTSHYSEVTVGFVHTCGLRIDGSILCWGSRSDGRSDPPTAGQFTQISAGGEHTCALQTDGRAVCWGKNHLNQVSPMPSGLFRQISAGGEHTCAMRVDGSVVCWGRYPSENETYSQISAGDFHTCGLRANGSISCWGDNQYGQAPSILDGTFSQVTCGSQFSCGLKTDGSVACWGGNADKVVSTLAEGPFWQIDAGFYHVCALKSDNSATCWGREEDIKVRH